MGVKMNYVLDPSSVGWCNYTTLLNELATWEVDAVRRVISWTARLLQEEAGSLGQCLDTAMVWERG
jgi:hypothetical protein